MLYIPGGGADADFWSRRVDVGTRGTLGQVDYTGADVDYGGVEERKWIRGGTGSKGGARAVCR